jgi:hypothetical protein
MIPQNNVGYVVAAVPFAKLDDLIASCQRTGILPTALPRGGGWDSIEIPVPRLDIKIRLSAQAQLGPVLLDAVVPSSQVEIRLAGTIRQISLKLELFELSSTQKLAQLDYAVSGRVAVSGTVESLTGEKALFFKLRRVWVTLDDATLGIPAPWPEIDLENLFTRLLDRGLRAELNVGGLLERRIPVDPNIETRGLISHPLYLGYTYQDASVRDDWWMHSVCLPSGGDPACHAGAPVNRTFMNTLDVFASRANAPRPDPINWLGRNFQIDIGAALIREAIQQQFSDKKFHPDPIKFGPFRYRIDVEADYQAIAGGGTDAEFALKATLAEDAWYPEVVFCRGEMDTPWGDKWYFDYPCDVRDGWLFVKKEWIETGFRFTSDGSGNICVQRRHIDWSSDFNTWGTIYAFVIEYVLRSIPYIGWIFSVAFMLWDAVYILVEVLSFIIAKLMDQILPGSICQPISASFAVLPQINDRVQLRISNPLVETKISGISVAFDGAFTP